jgi:hypothetical protein
MDDLKEIDCIKALRNFVLQHPLGKQCKEVLSMPAPSTDFPCLILEWGSLWGDGWIKSCTFTISLITSVHHVEDNYTLIDKLTNCFSQPIPLTENIFLKAWINGDKKITYKGSGRFNIFEYRGTICLGT